MKTNVREKQPIVTTHEGGAGQKFTPLQELKRTVATCLLFEPTFYETGDSVVTRLTSLAEKVKFHDLAETALWCRNTLNLRHVSLFLTVLAMKKNIDAPSLKRALVCSVIQRADEMAELISLYWKFNGRKNGSQKRPPLPNAMKKGIADAFNKFDEYQLSKWDSRSNAVRMRDVMFLCHPKPVDNDRAELYKRVADGAMKTPDTWETKLSAGADKKETFSTLIAENKLGALALLRNLRNMVQSGVERKLVREALGKANWKRVLPFRFLPALKHAPEYEDALNKAFLDSCAGVPKLGDDALVLIDVSGSMRQSISEKSEVSRAATAFATGAIIKETFDDAIVYGFNTNLQGPYTGRGLALTKEKTAFSATYPGQCLERAHQKHSGHIFDWVFLITDEQAHDRIQNKRYGRNQIVINVGTYENGMKLDENWIRLSGWSEKIFEFLKVDKEICEEV